MNYYCSIMLLLLTNYSYTYRKIGVFDINQPDWKLRKYDYSYFFQEPGNKNSFNCFVQLSIEDKRFLKNSLLGYSDAFFLKNIDESPYNNRHIKASKGSLQVIEDFKTYPDQLGNTVGDMRKKLKLNYIRS